MKIERVDERTVKCFLSNEELEEYDIDYKDFVLRSDKAKEVVQEIIEQAEEEVGYKPPRFAFDLQIVMLPEQGLILTFSERDSQVKEGEQFIECLREMRRLLQKTRERLGLLRRSLRRAPALRMPWRVRALKIQKRAPRTQAPPRSRGLRGRARRARNRPSVLDSRCLCSQDLEGLWSSPRRCRAICRRRVPSMRWTVSTICTC